MKKVFKVFVPLLFLFAISFINISLVTQQVTLSREEITIETRGATTSIISDETVKNGSTGGHTRTIVYEIDGGYDLTSDQYKTGINVFQIDSSENLKYKNAITSIKLEKVNFNVYFEDTDSSGWFDDDKGDRTEDREMIDPFSGKQIQNQDSYENSEMYFYYEDPTPKDGKACYNKKNKISIHYDDSGNLYIEETDRVATADFSEDFSDIDCCEEFDGDEQIKCTTNKTTYTFKIEYAPIYDISFDEWEEDESKNYKEVTQRNLIPPNKVLYTSKDSYKEINDDLLEAVNTTQWSESNQIPTDKIGVRFFPSLDEIDPEADVIDEEHEYLNSNKVYAEFYTLDSNDNYYYSGLHNESIGRNIIEYKIPYLEGYSVSKIEDGYHDLTSMNNESSIYWNGTLENNNIEIFLNTGANFRIYDEYDKSVENLKAIWLQSPPKSPESSEPIIENLWNDGESDYCDITIGEQGEYKLKLIFKDTLWPKGPATDGENDNELVIDIHVKDGQSFFDNDDLQDSLGNNIDHNYALYHTPGQDDNPGELYEYYKSDSTFSLNTSSASHYLISDKYMMRGEYESGIPYFGTLEKANIDFESGNIEWTNVEPSSGPDGEFCKDNEGLVRIGEGDENNLYKYTIKDVFGYDYTYYMETNIGNRDESLDYDSVYEDYFDTSEGIELLNYFMYNDPDVTDEAYVGDHYTYLDIERNRSVINGKMNLKYYHTNDSIITNEIGKIEYGTTYGEIVDEVDRILTEDLAREGYNIEDIMEFRHDTSYDTEIRDATELYYNIKGEHNSSVYGEVNAKVIPSVIRNLSLLQVDDAALTDVTSTMPEDVSFSQDMLNKLESNLFSQFIDNEENRYFNITQDVDHNKDLINDIEVQWYLPSNVGDYAKYGTTISYEITSTNPDYYFNSYSGSFESHAYYDLSRMKLNEELIQLETIPFKSGTKFVTMQERFEEVINNQLKLKLINPNNISIDWYVNDKEVNDNTIVHNDDIISYTVYSNGASNRFKYAYDGEFESLQYVDISDIEINTTELQQSLNLSYGGSEFSVIKDSLEENIRLQISSQIGNKYVDYIDINWLTGDDEILYAGKEISFELESNNKLRVHDSVNKYSIQYNEVEVPEGLTIIDILLLMIILLILCVILFIVVKLVV